MIKLHFYAKMLIHHCIKQVPIRTYSGPHFPGFRLNTERYFVNSENSESFLFLFVAVVVVVVFVEEGERSAGTIALLSDYK